MDLVIEIFVCNSCVFWFDFFLSMFFVQEIW